MLTDPLYRITIQLTPIPASAWSGAIARLGSHADLVTRLLLNELPDGIEEAFGALGLRLLPSSVPDFSATCSCPDWANPCKHIAGVIYVLAVSLDRDPFLLFELLGLSREGLHALLEGTPLEATDSYFTHPYREPVDPDLPIHADWHKEFWIGARANA